MKNNNLSKKSVKIISVSLALSFVLSLFVLPVSTYADVSYTEPTDLSEGLLIDPDNQTIYVGSTQIVKFPVCAGNSLR